MQLSSQDHNITCSACPSNTTIETILITMTEIVLESAHLKLQVENTNYEFMLNSSPSPEVQNYCLSLGMVLDWPSVG